MVIQFPITQAQRDAQTKESAAFWRHIRGNPKSAVVIEFPTAKQQESANESVR